MEKNTNSQPGICWRIVSTTKPVMWPRSDDEIWLLNPPNRYVITSDQQVQIQEHLASWSDLKRAALYNPLNGHANLAGKKILIERHRDRGIGDMLFVTGVINYLQHVSSRMCEVYYYGDVHKSHVLHGNEDLFCSMPMAGPVMYDTFKLYNYHWFIEAATEYDEEYDQSNVYDCLFKQIGVDPGSVDNKFKRPVVAASVFDKRRADDLFRLVYFERNEDWRKKPYWVLSPLTKSWLRSANYSAWLGVIDELSKVANVVVIGQASNSMMPDTDMPYDKFLQELSNRAQANKSVINLIGHTPLRLAVGLIAGAEGVISLDSGLLYIAQGLRIPAISIWGPHSPFVRIGYDQDYMDLAIWNRQNCNNCPCFAYRGFPHAKCPFGESQHTCEVLKVDSSEILAKVNPVLSRRKVSKA